MDSILCKKELTQQSWDYILKKACLQGQPLADIWELSFGEGSYHFLLRTAHCAEAVYINNTI